MMSVTTPRKRTEIPAELITRLRRQLIFVATVLLAIAAGWLGTVLGPHMWKFLLTLVTLALVSRVVVSAIAFFRDS